MKRPPFRPLLAPIAVLAGLAGLVAEAAGVDASAQPSTAIVPPRPAAEISGLMGAGKLDDALKRADAFLASNPRDAQVRFLRGVILSEQGMALEAISEFEGLTRDFPELPEPYNNLAVLVAAQGKYEQARSLLLRSLQAQPGYVTAYENLGDLYVSMAVEAYRQATQLDAKNRSAAAKLALARELSAKVRAAH